MIEESAEPVREDSDRREDPEENELKQRLEELGGTMLELKRDYPPPYHSFQQLKRKMDDLQVSLDALQETREQLVALNLRVRRQPDSAALKENVTELYQRWDLVYEHNQGQLMELRSLKGRWTDYLNRCQRVEETLRRPDGNRGQADSQLDELRAAARQLEKHLEGSRARSNIAETVTSLEEEAAGRLEEQPSEDSCGPTEEGESGAAQDEPEKKSASVWWRALRAAVPIQLALVTMYGLACLLEPDCCDLINNLNFSPRPHLRYVRGPPPV